MQKINSQKKHPAFDQETTSPLDMENPQTKLEYDCEVGGLSSDGLSVEVAESSPDAKSK